MTQNSPTEYRVFNLPGLGRVKAPDHMTEAELLAELHADDGAETNTPKDSKR